VWNAVRKFRDRAAVRYPESGPALRVSQLVIAVRQTLGSIGEAAKTANSDSVPYRYSLVRSALVAGKHSRLTRKRRQPSWNA
jgi:hypothetical protein